MAISPSEYLRQVIGLEVSPDLVEGLCKELKTVSNHRSAYRLVQKLKTNSDYNLRPRAVIT